MTGVPDARNREEELSVVTSLLTAIIAETLCDDPALYDGGRWNEGYQKTDPRIAVELRDPWPAFFPDLDEAARPRADAIARLKRLQRRRAAE